MVSAEEGIIDTYYVSCNHIREKFAAKHFGSIRGDILLHTNGKFTASTQSAEYT